jgi:hypothetical protein
VCVETITLSSVTVMAEEMEVPGMSDVPCQTSTRSKFVSLSCAFAPTGDSVFPIVAACAADARKSCCNGARTSMVDAREIAMTRRRIVEDAAMSIRRESAIVATLSAFAECSERKIVVRGWKLEMLLSDHGVALRVSSPPGSETRRRRRPTTMNPEI